MPDLKYLPGGNPLARIRHRPESEKWRVYQTREGWQASAPASVYRKWLVGTEALEEAPDQNLPTQAEALAYADRMARHG